MSDVFAPPPAAWRTGAQSPQDEGLPLVEVRTLVRAIWRRRWLIVVAFLGALLVGFLSGIAFGTREYQTETAILYRPQTYISAGGESVPYDSLSLLTQLHLVKIRSNIAEVRRRLGLATSLDQLGAATEVWVQKKTNLMLIGVRWDSPDQAAAVANTIRDVFLRNQLQMRLQGELVVVQRLTEDGRAEVRKLDGQISELDQITRRLEAQVASELTATPGDARLPDLNFRIERLRRAIHDDQTHRANMAVLAQKEIELERASQLHAQGLVAQRELEEIQAEVERLRALTLDTEEVQAWREEMVRLQETVLPVEEDAASSAPLLREILLYTINVDFDRVRALEKLAQLAETSTRLGEQLAATKTFIDSDQMTWREASDFRVVTVASAPAVPSTSNRRVVAIGVALLLVTLSLSGSVAIVALHPGVRSAAEATLQFSQPVLGMLPDALPSERNKDESYRIIGHRLRRALPQYGGRVLVVSATHREGVTAVAYGVAAMLGRQGEQVLVVQGGHGAEVSEAGCRWRAPQTRLHRLLALVPGLRGGGKRVSATVTRTLAGHVTPDGDTQGMNLSAYLGREDARLADVTLSTDCAGVSVVLRGEQCQESPLEIQTRLGSLFAEAAEQYDLTLIDGGPVLCGADAEILAQYADGIVMVVESSGVRRTAVRAAIARLSATGVPILGLVLNRTAEPFMDLE